MFSRSLLWAVLFMHFLTTCTICNTPSPFFCLTSHWWIREIQYLARGFFGMQTGPAPPPELQPSLRTLQKPVSIFRRRSVFKHEDRSFKIKKHVWLSQTVREADAASSDVLVSTWHYHRAAADVRRPSECSELILILTEHWDIVLSNNTRVVFRRYKQ